MTPPPHTCIVHRGDERVEIEYKKSDRGPWLVKTPEDDGFWEFATSTASSRTVQQLIRKKWCDRYSVDPDPLDNHD